MVFLLDIVDPSQFHQHAHTCKSLKEHEKDMFAGISFEQVAFAIVEIRSPVKSRSSALVSAGGIFVKYEGLALMWVCI